MDFYKSIAAYYDEIFTLKSGVITGIDGIISGAGKNILNIGCGTGSLDIGLAKIGYTMSGVDLDEEMIALAKQKAAGSKKNIKFTELNMLDVPAEFKGDEFDAVLCLGNTMVHLLEMGEIDRFLKGVRSVLREGGIFILQIVNYYRIIKRSIDTLPLIETENITFERTYFYDRPVNRILFTTVLKVKESGEEIENKVYLNPVRYDELETFLNNSGFKNPVYYGNLSKAPFLSDESMGLSVVAKTP